MKITANTVIFKSKEPYYTQEELGIKPNTVRLLTHVEESILLESTPTQIRITKREQVFQRTLTDISMLGDLLGYKLYVFSWSGKK